MIRDNVKRICREKGQTVSDLEEKAKISRGYIYNMKNPTYETLLRIARSLEVDVCELIEEAES